MSDDKYRIDDPVQQPDGAIYYPALSISGPAFRVNLSSVRVYNDLIHGRVAEGVVSYGYVESPGLGQRLLCPGEVRKWYIGMSTIEKAEYGHRVRIG